MNTELSPFEEIWHPLEIRSVWQDVIDARNEIRELIQQWEGQ